MRRTRKSWVFGGEDDRRRHVRPELARDVVLRFRPDLVHHSVPLAVRKPSGVVPGLDLPFEARVGPQMMAVRREMQPLGIRRQAAGEQRLETQRAVLSDHNSGKTRFSSVERK